jgi:hypothetical protein
MSDPARKRALAFVALLAALSAGLRAQSTLLYFELQAVAAYSTAEREVQFFSLMPADAMQKPSLGFDLVTRFSGKTRDIGVLAVQARLAYDEAGESRVEPQLYNAYFRLKTRPFDLWIGHNRPALGLASVLDSHALLLPAPPMLGFGFDRDWGIGVARDTSWGGLAASLTAGSGMPLRLRGNYLAAARVFKGVPARDNTSLGLSLAHGNAFMGMGYGAALSDPVDWTVASLDATYLWRNFEHRAEVLVGRRGGALTALAFYRAGLALLEEGRLKIELQPVLWRREGAWDHALGAGLAYLFNAELAGRFMVFDDSMSGGARFAIQLYYYKGI